MKLVRVDFDAEEAPSELPHRTSPDSWRIRTGAMCLFVLFVVLVLGPMVYELGRRHGQKQNQVGESE